MTIKDYTDVDIDIDLDAYEYSAADTYTIESVCDSIGTISISGGTGAFTTVPSWSGNNDITIPVGGDIKIGERSLTEFMSKMEDRLAILVPDPAMLEKYEALKKAYDHYKLMEKLCQANDKESK
jgi:hypothetical protein